MQADGLKELVKLCMTNSALGFAHQISQVFLTENIEPTLIKVYRLPAGEAEQCSVCFPQPYYKIVWMRHYTVQGLIKFQQNLLR